MDGVATTVTVSTPGGTYPIHIGKGCLQQLSQVVPDDATALVMVTNAVLAPLYAEAVQKSLEATGKPVSVLVLPDGEATKNQQTLDEIMDFLLAHGLDRKAVLVALGGGVIGDMVGFAAAIYMRGIRFIQIPTTLLAQVDSSVGGKTAINHPRGKNMIGAFYQPIAVEIDTQVLGTLPKRELTAGLAEVIKYGFIEDAEFLHWCSVNVKALLAGDVQALRYAIQRSCELKAAVVSEDERESGRRAILNFGHTFGHAIEAGLGYGQWLHGEAVGCGMVMAAELSRELGYLSAEEVTRTRDLVAAIGAPVQAPRWPLARWHELMQSDKKALGGELRFVVLTEIGQARVEVVDMDRVAQVLGH